MNYLAHAFLAQQQSEAYKLGNLMADHIKGPPENCLLYIDGLSPDQQQEVLDGIRYHRHIDRTVDHLPEVVALRTQFLPEYRRYAGIVLDMAWDYLLARNWPQYSDQSLAAFARQEYQWLQQSKALQPPSMRHMMGYMVRNNWFVSYQQLSGIERALKGLSIRIKRQNSLDQAASEIPRLETKLVAVFPELINHLIKQPFVLNVSERG